jgi:hypothetical protein
MPVPPRSARENGSVKAVTGILAPVGLEVGNRLWGYAKVASVGEQRLRLRFRDRAAGARGRAVYDADSGWLRRYYEAVRGHRLNLRAIP